MSTELRTFDWEIPLDDVSQCKKQAGRVARLLKPDWFEGNVPDVDCAQILDFQFFTEGITNKIFCVWPKHRAKNSDALVFRVYGRNTDLLIDRSREVRTWQLLASHDCAAPLYGQFANGLVCGYVPGKPLASVHVARQPSVAKFTELSTSEEILSEIVTVAQKVDRLNLDLVFSHNDLLLNNVLYDEHTESISFIDYEYACLNYRPFDIANHFIEFAGLEAPQIWSNYPDREFQLKWIRDYLNSSSHSTNGNLEENVEKLYSEVQLMQPVCGWE